MMILENEVIKILKKEMPQLEKIVKWDGMYDGVAKLIVKKVKEEITNA